MDAEHVHDPAIGAISDTLQLERCGETFGARRFGKPL
jgi:hypothetical protein